MATLFISDLHLSPQRPEIVDVFLRFLRGRARAAQRLYILGDLFEYWAGDDDAVDPFNASVIGALEDCASAGTELRLMHGNRDFLLGEGFSRASGVRLVPDPLAVDLPAGRAVLTHGDLLCTDDLPYQAFRAEVRSAAWARGFLERPLAERRTEIEALRVRSETEKKGKTAEIMDVNVGAVAAFFRAHGHPILIHGHTHRSARTGHVVDGRRCERWVLPDWLEAGGGLVADAGGMRFERYS